MQNDSYTRRADSCVVVILDAFPINGHNLYSGRRPRGHVVGRSDS